MATAVLERRQQEAILRPPEAGANRRGRAAMLAAGGALIMVLTVLVGALGLVRPGDPEATGTATPTLTPSFPEVGTVENTYEPAHTSGWHVHPGVHSVVVLAGRLTIYDAACDRREVGPGESYLGGRAPHLARNEAPEPVKLVVTYVFSPTTSVDHATVVPAPEGCDAR